MILGNCDYYQSFVDIAKCYFCGFFPFVSFLFTPGDELIIVVRGPSCSTVSRHYNFPYIGGCLKDFEDIDSQLRYINWV